METCLEGGPWVLPIPRDEDGLSVPGILQSSPRAETGLWAEHGHSVRPTLPDADGLSVLQILPDVTGTLEVPTFQVVDGLYHLRTFPEGLGPSVLQILPDATGISPPPIYPVDHGLLEPPILP